MSRAALPLDHGDSDAARAHKALTLDRKVWNQLGYAGVQPGPKGECYELRNCPFCGSTLNLRVSKAEALATLAAQAGVVARTIDALNYVPPPRRRKPRSAAPCSALSGVSP